VPIFVPKTASFTHSGNANISRLYFVLEAENFAGSNTDDLALG